MLRRKARPESERQEPTRSNTPRLIRINPDGRREVDPMSIIRSERGQQHLNDIRGFNPDRESENS